MPQSVFIKHGHCWVTNTGLSPSAFEPFCLTLYFWGETHNVSSAVFIGVWPNCRRCSSQCLLGTKLGTLLLCCMGSAANPPCSVPPLCYDNYYQFRLASSFPRRTYTTSKHEVSPHKSRLFFQTVDVNVPRIARIHWMVFLNILPSAGGTLFYLLPVFCALSVPPRENNI